MFRVLEIGYGRGFIKIEFVNAPNVSNSDFVVVWANLKEQWIDFKIHRYFGLISLSKYKYYEF